MNADYRKNFRLNTKFNKYCKQSDCLCLLCYILSYLPDETDHFVKFSGLLNIDNKDLF